MGHLVRGQPAQFFVHQRQQFVRSFGIAMLDGVEDACHLTHAFYARAVNTNCRARSPIRYATDGAYLVFRREALTVRALRVSSARCVVPTGRLSPLVSGWLYRWKRRIRAGLSPPENARP